MNWTLIFQGITSLGVIATLTGAIFAVKKYLYEKNRDINIRRLNEVYAPLFGMVVKQEEFRKSVMNNEFAFNKFPLISLNTTKEEISPEGHFKEDFPGLIHRDKFNEHFNTIDKGLASPKLLELINRFQMLDYLLIEKKYILNEREKLELRLVDIEKDIMIEIVEGYYDTVEKLEIDTQYERIHL